LHALHRKESSRAEFPGTLSQLNLDFYRGMARMPTNQMGVVTANNMY